MGDGIEKALVMSVVSRAAPRCDLVNVLPLAKCVVQQLT